MKFYIFATLALSIFINQYASEHKVILNGEIIDCTQKANVIRDAHSNNGLIIEIPEEPEMFDHSASSKQVFSDSFDDSEYNEWNTVVFSRPSKQGSFHSNSLSTYETKNWTCLQYIAACCGCINAEDEHNDYRRFDENTANKIVDRT